MNIERTHPAAWLWLSTIIVALDQVTKFLVVRFLDLYCAPGLLDGLRPLGDELRFVLIVSAARVHELAQRPADAVAGEGFALGADGQPQLWIVAQPSTATKCVRCWHKREDVGHSDRHPQLCARCVTNIEGPGEQRRFA